MRYAIAILIFIAFSKCANQTSPNGGPQDKKPPELISTLPKSNQRNFQGDKIELTFNELIKLKDPGEEIMISPSVGKETKFNVKKNKLIIVPKNKLQQNTTYNISFRDAVQDLNEGNPIFNLRLAFSTGEDIDTAQISGRIFEISKDEIPETITVALYQSDTFNIFTHQPIYFTRTDKKGKFTITNLKPGDYYAYAFDDKSKNLKVESKSERFGFLSKKFTVKSNVDSLVIPLVRIDARPIKITSVRNTERISKVRINKMVTSAKVESEYKNYFIHTYGDKQDELIFYGILREQPQEDSIKISLQLQDSVGNILDTIAYLKSVKVKIPKETFKINFAPPQYHLEDKTVTSRANFNKPISSFNLDSIYFQLDSLHFQPVKKENIAIDSLTHQLSIKTVLQLKKPEKIEQQSQPILVLGKGAFISLNQDSSRAQTFTIKIPKEESLGSFAVTVVTKEKNYFIELLTSSGQLISRQKNIKQYVFKYLEPQEYKIQALIDTNNNGVWDPGNFQKGIEPEKIFLYKTFDGKVSTPVRANWDVGPLVITF